MKALSLVNQYVKTSDTCAYILCIMCMHSLACVKNKIESVRVYLNQYTGGRGCAGVTIGVGAGGWYLTPLSRNNIFFLRVK